MNLAPEMKAKLEKMAGDIERHGGDFDLALAALLVAYADGKVAGAEEMRLVPLARLPGAKA